MNFRIGRWIQIGLFAALPVATAGLAFAEDPTPSGDVAPSRAPDNLPSVNDTGSKLQQKSNDTIDNNAPSNPMNSDKPMDQKNMDQKGMDDANKAPDTTDKTINETTTKKTHTHKKTSPHMDSGDTDLNK